MPPRIVRGRVSPEPHVWWKQSGSAGKSWAPRRCPSQPVVSCAAACGFSGPHWSPGARGKRRTPLAPWHASSACPWPRFPRASALEASCRHSRVCMTPPTARLARLSQLESRTSNLERSRPNWKATPDLKYVGAVRGATQCDRVGTGPCACARSVHAWESARNVATRSQWNAAVRPSTRGPCAPSVHQVCTKCAHGQEEKKNGQFPSRPTKVQRLTRYEPAAPKK